jgi:hypothetical protein
MEKLDVLFNADVEYVLESDAEGYMRKLVAYKDLYMRVKNEHAEDEIEDEQRTKLLEVLHIPDLEQDKFLNTMVLFEDITNSSLFKNSSSYFNHLLTTLRHINCEFFMCIHFWKGIPASIKTGIVTLYAFPPFSRQQLSYIASQVTSITYEELVYETKKMKHQQKLVVDTVSKKYSIQ